MFAQVAVLAVVGDQDARAQDVVHRLEVGAVGVARHVVEPVAVVDHVDALFGQRVL